MCDLIRQLRYEKLPWTAQYTRHSLFTKSMNDNETPAWFASATASATASALEPIVERLNRIDERLGVIETDVKNMKKQLNIIKTDVMMDVSEMEDAGLLIENKGHYGKERPVSTTIRRAGMTHWGSKRSMSVPSERDNAGVPSEREDVGVPSEREDVGVPSEREDVN